MRVYLSVPFIAKDRAKALGARWDPERRQWFVPDGIDAAEFTEWLPPEWREYHERANARPKKSRDRVIRNATRLNHSTVKSMTGASYRPCGGGHTTPPWVFEPCSPALGCHVETYPERQPNLRGIGPMNKPRSIFRG